MSPPALSPPFPIFLLKVSEACDISADIGFMRDFRGTFDRVVVINLARRPERLGRFWQLLSDWPLLPPERFEAIDGSATLPPATWQRGAGAWGCMLSHRAVLRTALRDGVSSLLCLEDDAYPVEDFAARAADFLNRVPADWDCLMLGCEHLRPPTPHADGIVQCVCANRMHAYALRARMMQVLLEALESATNDHCDIVLASLMGHFKTYAPDPPLIGQDAGFSDISQRSERLRFLGREDRESIAAANPRYQIERLITPIHPKSIPLKNLRPPGAAPKNAARSHPLPA
jgi:GR25 family glycosyltransferase involved in LPS biosynthesis